MTEIKVDECIYKIHPIYNLYAGSEDGNIIHIIKQIPHIGNKNHNGYMKCWVRKHGQSSQKAYYVHRFIYECYYGVIDEGMVVNHINNNKEDNNLSNLQLVTPQQNCEKSAKDRDYSFTAKNHKNQKCVKATNCTTKEVTYFKSMYAINQYLGINAGIVKMVCEGLNNCKSGISKKDGHSYTFEYIKEEYLPDNYKKSTNIRPRKTSDQEKKKHRLEWLKKEFTCQNCDKVYKNGYKYIHKKHCKNSKKQ